MLYRWILIGVGILSAIFLVGGSHGVTGELTPEEAARYEALQSQSFTTFSNVDLSDYLRLRNKLLADDPGRPAPPDEIGHYVDRSTDLPYRNSALRFDLADADCVTFCERTIALSSAQDWYTYRLLSDRLRHKDGRVEYTNRNFSTLGDWVPNNAWLCRDVTGELGADGNRPAQQYVHIVRPKVFDYSRTPPIFRGSDYKSGIKEVRTDLYIPKDRISDVLSDLRTGDMTFVLRPSAGKSMSCEHMGLMVRPADGGPPLLVHCAPPRLFREPLNTFLRRCHWVTGFKFLRLRDDARMLVDAELARLGPSAVVPQPAEQDEINQQQRANRDFPVKPTPKR